MSKPTLQARERHVAALRRTLADVFAHAVSVWPEECCGMIHASGRVRRCRNAIADVGRLDPALVGRSATDGFAFAAADAIFLAESMDGDDPVRVIYHSHTRADAGLSAADRRCLHIDGRAAYGHLMQLIVECREGRARGAVLYAAKGGEYRRVAVLGTDFPGSDTRLSSSTGDR